MTLIITCLTHAFAVQASDRRVTLMDNSGIEDRANKALFLGWNTTWSYTGLAMLEGIRTDEWIWRRLKNSTLNLAETSDAVATKAQKAVRMIPFPREMSTAERDQARRLAFVVSGFIGLSKAAKELAPFLMVVSNFHRPPGRWSSTADRNFSTWIYNPPARLPFVLFTAGQELGPTARTALVRNVRIALARGVGRHGIARILVDAIRDVANVRSSVGRSVMCSLVNSDPQSPEDNEIRGAPVHLSSTEDADRFRPADFNGPSFIYAPGSPNDRVAFFPMYIFPNKLSWGGGVFGPSDEVSALKDKGPFPPYRFTAL